jgi:hypothetical protein
VSVSLRGNLQDFGIADVFQLIGQQRKTGVLEFSGEAGQVQLRFDRGAVVSAAPVGARAEEALGEMLVRCGRLTREQVELLVPECEASAQTVPRLAVARGWLTHAELERIEDLLTRETFFEVLRWERGAFDFRSQPVEHGRRFESLLGAEQILMDGLRMVDEWHSFAELVPSEDAVFQRQAGFEEYRQRSQLESSQGEAAERVYQLVDGRIPVRRIVDLSLLGSFDAVRLLADMRRCGVIEPLDGAALQALRSLPRLRPTLGLGFGLRVLAATLPLALLAGVAVFAALREPAPPAVAGAFELRREALADVRAAYRSRGARHALEAHRFAAGRWPDSLAQLERSGFVPRGALAAEGAPAYYFAVRKDGAVLLAPER